MSVERFLPTFVRRLRRSGRGHQLPGARTGDTSSLWRGCGTVHGGCLPLKNHRTDARSHKWDGAAYSPLQVIMKLFDLTTIPALGRALGAYALRHKTIAANIANVGTADYIPKQVNFEEQLSSEDGEQLSLRGTTTDARHIPIGVSSATDAQPYVEDVKAPNGDGLASGVNGVDIDQEMSELAKNQIRYKFASRLAGQAFQALEKSIRGTQ